MHGLGALLVPQRGLQLHFAIVQRRFHPLRFAGQHVQNRDAWRALRIADVGAAAE